MEPESQSLELKVSSQSSLIWLGIAVVSIICNLVFLWITSIELGENKSIFYWQKFDKYFFSLRCLTFLITPIAIWFLSTMKARIWMTFMAIIGYCFILGFINYASLFIVNVINHVGTVELKGSVHQLATVEKFDDETNYYLGECDYTGYTCEFHSVYSMYLGAAGYVPEISLSDDSQQLEIKIDDEIVYTYNGVQEQCIDSDFGDCMTSQP